MLKHNNNRGGTLNKYSATKKWQEKIKNNSAEKWRRSERKIYFKIYIYICKDVKGCERMCKEKGCV